MRIPSPAVGRTRPEGARAAAPAPAQGESAPTSSGRLRHLTAALVALVLAGVGLATAGPAAAADPVPQPITFGELSWGFSEALRTEVAAAPGGTVQLGYGTRYDETAPGTATTRPYVFRQYLAEQNQSHLTGSDLRFQSRGWVGYDWNGIEVTVYSPALVVTDGVAKITGSMEIDTPDLLTVRWGVTLATVGHLTRTQTATGLQLVATDVRLAEYGAFPGYPEGTVVDDVRAFVATTTPSVETSALDFRSDGSARVTVTGTGFAPTWAVGLDAPTRGTLSGVRVAVGRFTSHWQPSDDWNSFNRTTDPAAQVWAVPAASLDIAKAAAIAEAPPGVAPVRVVELKPDGTFQATLTVTKAAIDAAQPPQHVADYSLYVFPGGQAYVPAFESVRAVTFHEGIASATSVDPVTAVAGKPVAVRARVSADGRVPTGTVVVRSSGTEVGTASLADGVADVTLAALPAGSHDLTVEYLGDAWVKPSTGTVTAAVAKAVPTISASFPTVTFGTPASTVIRVTAPGVSTDGAKVVVRGTDFTRSAVVTAGKVTIALPVTFAPGRYPATVSYAGTSEVRSATKNVTLTIVKASSTTAVSVSPKTVSTSGTPTVTVTVKATGTTPTGRVTLKVAGNGASYTRYLTLSGGKATVKLGSRKAGTYTVTATYGGSDRVKTSTSTTSFRVV
jgi:hypothetical protein